MIKLGEEQVQEMLVTIHFRTSKGKVVPVL